MKRMNPKQNGIALIFVLLILVVVSLLGIGGAQLAMMGERGARNERDTQVARQYAEEALVDAEFDIRGPGTSPRKDFFNSETNFSTNCGTSGDLQGLCAQATAGKPVWLTVNFEDPSANANYMTLGGKTGRTIPNSNGNGIQPAFPPRYIVEWLPDKNVGKAAGLETSRGKAAGSIPAQRLYRVTAMGFGPRLDIQTVLQMVYRKEQL
jgi:type IV pilus assembly protein PilX